MELFPDKAGFFHLATRLLLANTGFTRAKLKKNNWQLTSVPNVPAALRTVSKSVSATSNNDVKLLRISLLSSSVDAAHNRTILLQPNAVSARDPITYEALPAILKQNTKYHKTLVYVRFMYKI